jgi:hypothetical protein
MTFLRPRFVATQRRSSNGVYCPQGNFAYADKKRCVCRNAADETLRIARELANALRLAEDGTAPLRHFQDALTQFDCSQSVNA